MPMQLNEDEHGKILSVHVSGILAKADYEQFVPEFERLAGRRRKLRVLFDMTDFHGWEVAAIWQEIRFDVKHLPGIEWWAMVGDMQWQHVMATFCRPFMKTKMQCFDQTDAVGAWKWLNKA